MAPVTFLRDSGKPVQPYHVSPWQNEGLKDFPAPVLASLRGDWFCIPFGGNGAEFRGEKHPPHGEVAGSEWALVDSKRSGTTTTLVLAFEPTQETVLREQSMLTRDARKVERKKYGQAGARRRFQFSKR